MQHILPLKSIDPTSLSMDFCHAAHFLMLIVTQQQGPLKYELHLALVLVAKVVQCLQRGDGQVLTQ